MAGYAQDPSGNTLDPGKHFTKATEDPGDTIEYAPGETFVYTDAESSESPDDPLFPA